MTYRQFEGWNSYGRRLAAVKGNRDWGRPSYCRSVMLAEGDKLFFTGKACKRGHVSPHNEHGDCTQRHVMRLAERRDAV
ncbi:MAG: hypothetical protein NXH82_01570 [Rhodobacteraceae bacterium]|nr:hypothetical protein [Paracoccaceae bacterium]